MMTRHNVGWAIQLGLPILTFVFLIMWGSLLVALSLSLLASFIGMGVNLTMLHYEARKPLTEQTPTRKLDV